MKIRLISDTHNEVQVLRLPVMEDDHEQVLILAGDIGLAEKSKIQETIVEFIEELSPRFKHIIYVFGNHEFYHSEYKAAHKEVAEATAHIDNLTILQDSFIEIDDYIFVGATLWTDLCFGDPLIMSEAKRAMSDYWVVKNNDLSNEIPSITPRQRRLTPEVTIREHQISKDYIFHICAENRDKKVVVVSHHAPSYKSVAMKYRAGEYDMVMNYNFHSNIDEDILANDNIVLYCHGHTHTNFDYQIGDTRVVCNPRGYHPTNRRTENIQFDKKLVIEI